MKQLAAVLVLARLFAATGFAHDFEITTIFVVLDGAGGYQVGVSVDADALALGLPPNAATEEVAAGIETLPEADVPAAIERARVEVARLVELRFDGERVTPDVEFPQNGTPEAAVGESRSFLGVIAQLKGRVPPQATSATLRADPSLKTIDARFIGQGEPIQYLLDPGEESPPFPVGAGAVVEQGVWGRYVKLGFAHILPKGLDHILFVLGLFLLSARIRPLLWQVTAFTVAHSATLALSMLGIVSLPSQPVETLIALSIAYVAVENIVTDELKAWRPFVVFAFGLLHGLGFAGVLRELGMPEGRFVSALIAFNVGVELGQLAVIAAASVVVARFRGHPRYRRIIVVPASAAIAAVGLWWAFERAFA